MKKSYSILSLYLLALVLVTSTVLPAHTYAETETSINPPVKWTYNLSVSDPDVPPTTYIPTWLYFAEKNDTIFANVSYLGPRRTIQAIDKTGKKKWDVISNPAGEESHAVVARPDEDGSVYIYQGAEEIIAAYDPNGKKKWDHPIHNAYNTFPTTPIFGKKGLLLAIEQTTVDIYTLFAFQKTSGKLLWKYVLPSYAPLSNSEDIVVGPDGTIYFQQNANTISALNPDGTIKWTEKVFVPVVDIPHFDKQGNLYFFTASGILGLYPDGSRKMKYEPKNNRTLGMTQGPDSTLYLHDYQTIHAVKTDGTLLWQYSFFEKGTGTQTEIVGKPSVGYDGTIYVITRPPKNNTYQVFALNKNGTKKWHYDMTAEFDSFHTRLFETRPAFDKAGNVYVPIDKYLFAIKPDGTQKWTYEAETHYVVDPYVAADGTVYSATYKRLTAFGDKQAEKKLKSLQVSKTRLTLKEKEETKLSLHATYTDGSKENVTEKAAWSTSNASVATIQNGTVTAVAKGTAKITVTYQGKKSTVSVTVQ
ncbi:outer membrane protein assembly factor BamB family protein [Brevibacillus dissolubilis]|uniref:outer membrane protein assembly factor BamB family protein n=1 Tax=Brevibacillus dissolubilis TaxID=1844116 RepID=UPI0011174F3A|nr:PQQ-binding-like beta-propeller repeat protein [Brevibacillus dissolubilis]